MQSSDVPANVQVPFASGAGGGYVRAIPVAPQAGNAASFTTGFPVPTFTPLPGGGTPPDGKDINGIHLYETTWLQWLQAGYFPKYDATFSGQIGGYPLGAILRRADGKGFWRSTTENNATNPDAAGAGWVAHGLHSVFGRTTPDIVATNGDYSASQISYDLPFLLGTNGYEVSQSGKIEIWGTHTSSADSEFVAFPSIPGYTPTACLNVVATVVGNNSSSVDNIQTDSWTSTGFTAYARLQERTFSWRAIVK